MLDGVAGHRKEWQTSAVLLSDAGPSSRPRVIMSGWACRQLILPDGRRQIFGFLIPGDIVMPDCEKLVLGSIVALTPVSTSDLPAVETTSSFYMENGICALALAAAAQQREYLLNQQVYRLGGMQAAERLKHLLLEFCERLGTVGLFDGQALSFPFTQEAVADALGMSAVHVNRVFKQLRLTGVLKYASRDTLLIDVQKLAGAVETSG